SPDSVLPNLRDRRSYNPFVYVKNSPTSLRDPTGHCSQDDTSDCHSAEADARAREAEAQAQAKAQAMASYVTTVTAHYDPSEDASRAAALAQEQAQARNQCEYVNTQMQA